MNNEPFPVGTSSKRIYLLGYCATATVYYPGKSFEMTNIYEKN